MTSADTAAASVPPSPATPEAASAASSAPNPPGDVPDADLAQEATDVAPRFDFHLFSDTNFSARSDDPHTQFSVGGVDFFGTANISPRVRALSESVLEIFGHEATFDLERIYLEWDALSWLTLRLGRTHVMLGQYMATYHHALLFQLAASRPALLAFEDDGGFLPAHQIGLEMFGRRDVSSSWTLGYAASVGNGRGQFSDDILSKGDRNEWKSALLRLYLQPISVPGLEFGVSGYFDRIPKGASNGAGKVLVTEDLYETITGAHVLYDGYPFEMHAEGYVVRHQGVSSQRTYELGGGFAQAGYTVSDFTPYIRGEVVERTKRDPFYNASGAASQVRSGRIGTRYALFDSAVLKLEYELDVMGKRTSHAVNLQAAFGL